jgi:hypothetical protein
LQIQTPRSNKSVPQLPSSAKKAIIKIYNTSKCLLHGSYDDRLRPQTPPRSHNNKAVSKQWIVATIGFYFITFCFDLFSKHFQTVVARFIDFARLALGTEVAITRRQFVNNAI